MILTLMGSSGSYRPCSCAENPRILFFSKSRPRWLLIVENKESWSRFFEPCPGNSPFIGFGRNQLNRISTIEACVGRANAAEIPVKRPHLLNPEKQRDQQIQFSTFGVRVGRDLAKKSISKGDHKHRPVIAFIILIPSAHCVRSGDSISSPSVHCDNSIIPSLC